MKNIKNFFILALFSIPLAVSEASHSIRLERFSEPFCMIGNGNSEAPFQQKLTTLRRYQRKISRKTADFYHNRNLERRSTLHGSPKWVTYRYLAHRKYNREEIQFAFFAMTLFGEARNLSEESIEMVARVINNRRKGRNYADTVTELAQFSAWYYKNQRDNVVLLCPPAKQTKNWNKVVQVALKHFEQDDDYLGSTHYFSPYNMVPRYSSPIWARGRRAVSYGGHIFLVDQQKYQGEKEIITIPKKGQRIRAVRGEIIL